MRKLSVVSRVGAITVFTLLFMAAYCTQTQYQQAGKLAKDFAAGVLLAQQTEIQLYQAGKIDVATHGLIQTKFSQLADAGTSLDRAINQTHSATDAKTEIDAIDATLNDLSVNGISGIKDPQTRIAVQESLLAVQTIVDNILAIGGGK